MPFIRDGATERMAKPCRIGVVRHLHMQNAPPAMSERDEALRKKRLAAVRAEVRNAGELCM